MAKLTYDKQLTALLVIDPPSVPIWESEGAVFPFSRSDLWPVAAAEMSFRRAQL